MSRESALPNATSAINYGGALRSRRLQQSYAPNATASLYCIIGNTGRRRGGTRKVNLSQKHLLHSGSEHWKFTSTKRLAEA